MRSNQAGRTRRLTRIYDLGFALDTILRAVAQVLADPPQDNAKDKTTLILHTDEEWEPVPPLDPSRPFEHQPKNRLITTEQRDLSRAFERWVKAWIRNHETSIISDTKFMAAFGNSHGGRPAVTQLAEWGRIVPRMGGKQWRLVPAEERVPQVPQLNNLQAHQQTGLSVAVIARIRRDL